MLFWIDYEYPYYAWNKIRVSAFGMIYSLKLINRVKRRPSHRLKLGLPSSPSKRTQIKSFFSYSTSFYFYG
jgi:hypothetical protein